MEHIHVYHQWKNEPIRNMEKNKIIKRLIPKQRHIYKIQPEHRNRSNSSSRYKFFHENSNDKLYEKKFINEIKFPNENFQNINNI